MYDSAIKLISETKVVDEYGDMVPTESINQVFAELKSIGQTEFYQAQAVGLRPEVKFIIPDFLDYHTEKRLLFTPFGGTEEEFEVIRTYRSGNTMELVCRRGVDS